MKIGIVGSQGVGKTTLSQMLAKKLKVPLIEEQIRKSIEMFGILGYNTPDEMVGSNWYSHLVFDIFKRQLYAENTANGRFISDRTTLDYFAYYELLTNDEQFFIDIFRNLFLGYYQKNYDLLIYVPIMFPIPEDNYRNTNETFRLKVDQHLQSLLNLNNNVYKIKSLTLNDRINEIINLLEKYK